PLLIIDGEKDHTVPWAIARLLQAAEAKPGGDRDQADPEPRSLADDRLGLGGGRPHRPRLRQAAHLTLPAYLPPYQRSVSAPSVPSSGSALGRGTARMLATASSCSAGSPRRMSQ